MRSRLIVIEGTDSSGKATQSALLLSALEAMGERVMKVEFPDYKSESSALVKMYLNGEFGSSAGDVSAYTASVFYAVDRFASYRKKWKAFFDNGGIIVADRYVTSNMIHQAAKLEDKTKVDAFLKWIENFEYGIMGIPRPDDVVFLEVEPQIAIDLMKNRANKFSGGDQKDIHEKDNNHLLSAYNAAKYCAERFGWKTVNCTDGSKMRSIEDISREIIKILGY